MACSCRGKSPECDRCGGSGKITGKQVLALSKRDPLAARHARRAFEAFLSYHAHGLLPIAGGVAEQSASVVEAINIARAEVGRIEAEERREREAEMERERLRHAAIQARDRRRR